MRNALAENLPENRKDWSPDDALFRFAQSLVDGTRQCRAVEQVLKKAYPTFRHIPSKEKIIDPGKDLIQESIHAVTHLDHSEKGMLHAFGLPPAPVPGYRHVTLNDCLKCKFWYFRQSCFSRPFYQAANIGYK